MRRVLLFGGMALWLLSCGNSGDTAGNSDSATTTTTNTTTTTDGTGTGASTGTMGSDTSTMGTGAGTGTGTGGTGTGTGGTGTGTGTGGTGYGWYRNRWYRHRRYWYRRYRYRYWHRHHTSLIFFPKEHQYIKASGHGTGPVRFDTVPHPRPRLHLRRRGFFVEQAVRSRLSPIPLSAPLAE
jgi:hypothetical protein